MLKIDINSLNSHFLLRSHDHFENVINSKVLRKMKHGKKSVIFGIDQFKKGLVTLSLTSKMSDFEKGSLRKMSHFEIDRTNGGTSM